MISDYSALTAIATMLTSVCNGDRSNGSAKNHFASNELIHRACSASNDGAQNGEGLPEQDYMATTEDIGQSAGDGEANRGSSSPARGNPKVDSSTANFL